MRRRTRRALLGVAAVPIAATALLAAEVQLARMGPDLEDDTPLDHDVLVDGVGTTLRMVWIGDSTAAGVGASSPEQALPALVARDLGRRAEVYSLAVSGDRVGDVLADQVPALAALRPDVVLVSMGANDVVHLTSRSAFRDAYRSVLDAIPVDAVRVVLGVPDMGAPPRMAQPLRAIAGLRGRQLEGDARKIAVQERAVYVDIAGETGPTMRSDTGRYFARDRYHPSDAGYELWAAAVVAALRPVLTESPEVASANR